MKQGVLFILILVQASSFAQKQTIALRPMTKDKVNMFFTTRTANIFFTFSDFIRAVEKTRRTTWYSTLDPAIDQRLNKTIDSLLGYYKTANRPLLNGKPTAATIYIDPNMNPLLLDIIQANVGSLLLMEGKASVTKIPLMRQSEIKIQTPKQTDGGSYSFFFTDGGVAFFKGELHTTINSNASVVPVDIPAWKEDSVISKPLAKEEIDAAQADNQIYVIVEQQPIYPGSLSEFEKYVLKNVSASVKSSMAGQKVWAQFIVEKDGTLSDVTISKPSNAEQSAKDAFKRAIQSSRGWVPGRQRGVPRRVRLMCSIKVDQ